MNPMGACGAVRALLRPEEVAPLAGEGAPHVVSACDAVGRGRGKGFLGLGTWSEPGETCSRWKFEIGGVTTG